MKRVLAGASAVAIAFAFTATEAHAQQGRLDAGTASRMDAGVRRRVLRDGGFFRRRRRDGSVGAAPATLLDGAVRRRWRPRSDGGAIPPWRLRRRDAGARDAGPAELDAGLEDAGLDASLDAASALPMMGMVKDGGPAVVMVPLDSGPAPIGIAAGPLVDAGAAAATVAANARADAGALATSSAAGSTRGLERTERVVRVVPVGTGGAHSAEPEAWQIADRLLPAFPRSRSTALFHTFVVLVCFAFAAFLSRWRATLPRHGVIPRTVGLTRSALRLLGVLFALSVFAHLMPSSIWPALPWVVLAAAAAIGWSARDVLPDLLAGMVLAIDRRIRPGQWITCDGQSGEIESVGLRAVWLRDENGRAIALPNRKLVSDAVQTDAQRWPLVEVSLRFPSSLPSASVRRALTDAALLSPWRATSSPTEVLRDPSDPERWRVRTRLLEARYTRSFEASLLDAAEEILAIEAAPATPAPAP